MQGAHSNQIGVRPKFKMVPLQRWCKQKSNHIIKREREKKKKEKTMVPIALAIACSEFPSIILQICVSLKETKTTLVSQISDLFGSSTGSSTLNPVDTVHVSEAQPYSSIIHWPNAKGVLEFTKCK